MRLVMEIQENLPLTGKKETVEAQGFFSGHPHEYESK